MLRKIIIDFKVSWNWMFLPIFWIKVDIMSGSMPQQNTAFPFQILD